MVLIWVWGSFRTIVQGGGIVVVCRVDVGLVVVIDGG